MTLDEQIATLEAENAKLRDEQIATLQARISVLQVQLDTLLEFKAAQFEEANLKLREALESLKQQRQSPLKGRQVLEDYECAISTFIKRYGGIKIPKDLKEELGGWWRLHNDKGIHAGTNYKLDQVRLRLQAGGSHAGTPKRLASKGKSRSATKNQVSHRGKYKRD